VEEIKLKILKRRAENLEKAELGILDCKGNKK
jgi:hypothetical protein